MPGSCTFRPLIEADFGTYTRWMNEPHVNRWWARAPVTPQQVRAKLLPRLRGEQPVHCLLALLDDAATGYVQTYRAEDFPDAVAHVDVPPGGWSFDWFIGEPSVLGRGEGARLLQAFARYAFARFPARYLAVGSRLANRPAHRSHARAGFRPWSCTPPHADADGYYRLDRQQGALP